jgi:YidC/Oxa1 family membrane protein insertase
LTPIAPNQPEQTLAISNDLVRYTFTSHGGGIKILELLHYKQRVECRNQTGTNAPATLNRESTVPILSLLPNEALQGDGVYKLTATTNGVRAEKALTNGLVLINEFQPTSNYLVNATMRIENRSSSPVALAQQEWNVGSAGPMTEDDSVQNLGILWYDGSGKHAEGESWFANYTFGCPYFGANPRTLYSAGATNVVWAEVHNQFFTTALMPSEKGHQVTARKLDLPPPPREVLAANPRATLKPYAFQASIAYAPTTLAPNQGRTTSTSSWATPDRSGSFRRSCSGP